MFRFGSIELRTRFTRQCSTSAPPPTISPFVRFPFRRPSPPTVFSVAISVSSTENSDRDFQNAFTSPTITNWASDDVDKCIRSTFACRRMKIRQYSTVDRHQQPLPKVLSRGNFFENALLPPRISSTRSRRRHYIGFLSVIFDFGAPPNVN